MSEEEQEKKPVKSPDEIVEKRVKPAVIRRRAKKPAPPTPEPVAAEPAEAPAEKPVKESAEFAPEAKEAKAPEAKAPVKKAEPKATKKAEPEAAKKAEPKAAKKAGPEAAKKVEPKGAQKAEPKAVKKAEPEAAKEERTVKVFDQAPKEKPFMPATQVFKTGKKRRRPQQQRPRQRRNKTVQANRPLLKTEITTPKAVKRVIRIVDAISVADLSQRLGVKAGDIIKKLMALGIMSTVNQLIDFDAATLVAGEFGYEVESAGPQEETLLDLEPVEGETGVELTRRPPVVTVMGHVDHGKTSLLDVIRKTNVVRGEAGGITQHIGAYHVHLDKGNITFLDTPGHEAFTAMRGRGAKATDIVVLVVAADDGVKPQTIEAINHAKEAEVPIIVAINKIDLPEANPDRVRQEISQYGLVSEEWGGDTIFTEVSAKQQTNIQELLELILLQADMLELKAPVDTLARGLIVEAKLDKGRGPVATVLIQRGTLKTGDAFVTGKEPGKVRAMISDSGKRIETAGPSMPIEILGLSGVPSAGDDFVALKDEASARQVAILRQNKADESSRTTSAKVSLEDLYDRITKGEVKELKIVIKADVQGSIEAIKDALEKLSTDAISLVPIHTGVGGISEGDCMLAAASSAVVVGFHVRPELKAQRFAEKEGVDIRLYNVIYDLVEEVRNAMEGMLEPIIREKVIATVEIRDVIRITKVGNVAGSYVLDGTVKRNSMARLLRDNIVVFDAKLSSLKRFKEDVKEVAAGYECGMTLEGYNDYKVGDIIEVYILEEEAAKL